MWNVFCWNAGFAPLNFAAVTASTHELTCTALPILRVLVALVTQAAVGAIHVLTEAVSATHRAVRTLIHICRENCSIREAVWQPKAHIHWVQNTHRWATLQTDAATPRHIGKEHKDKT